MELTNYVSEEVAKQIQSALSSQEISNLVSQLAIVDDYSDATAYDEVLSQWMDEQGYYDNLSDFVDSYIDLDAKLKAQNLTAIPPYKAVNTVITLLSPIAGNDNLDEATQEHDNEQRPSRMERPNISGLGSYSSLWPGFYIGDQLESILIDKYGITRGEKMFNGLLDTGNNAIYTVCGDIMKEKYKMLSDMGEKPRRYDYFDINYFNLWKTWVANKGRKATKTGKIEPAVIKEDSELTQLANEIITICNNAGIDDRHIFCVPNDNKIELKLFADLNNLESVINARREVRDLIGSKGLKSDWKIEDSQTAKGKILIGVVTQAVAAPEKAPINTSIPSSVQS